MRRESTREGLEKLMQAMGQGIRGAGRVYFTGGTTAVLHGWRQSTIDVDLRPDPEPEGFFEALPALKESLQVNLELASPADFLPTLPGWRERSLFIARHGRIDFHHYDLYSQALAKIERFHERDRLDVTAMLERGLVQAERLRELFRAIQPELIRFPAVDPLALARRVQDLLH